MITEKREKLILKLSFFSGLVFAIAEFVFAIYSHSQSSLTDAVYDATELVFIALLLYLTPLFHKPISEKHPFGYFQIETVFLIIKGIMMLSVSLGVAAEILHSALSGGNPVDSAQVSLFQCALGIASILCYFTMKRGSRDLSSPTVEAELLGWKLDIVYSLGMSLAFFLSRYLELTPLAFLAPYFDQIIAVLVILFMLPENIQLLSRAFRDIFLFPPDQACVEEIRALCCPILEQYHFDPVFFDITKTGRHLWVAIYFQIQAGSLAVRELSKASQVINQTVSQEFQDCTCELILKP